MNHRLAFSTPSSNSWILPFMLGASASLSVLWISKNWQTSTSTSSTTTSLTTTTQSERKSPSNNKTGNDVDVLDHEQLSNRILRKAEAVIQWRTSRLILVVERCTNGTYCSVCRRRIEWIDEMHVVVYEKIDWYSNYSLFLYSFLFCRPSFLDHNYSAILRTAEALGIQTVYMIDPPDIKMEEGDEIEDTQKKITRTPEEIEQRRLHHIFAQNAVCIYFYNCYDGFRVRRILIQYSFFSHDLSFFHPDWMADGSGFFFNRRMCSVLPERRL